MLSSIHIEPYKPKNRIRLVTAASLFDGHDAAINLMRRILQSSGAEIVHLGHNRSAQEIVECAIQEDVQGIAITSYQGGHEEYFKYIYDLIEARGARIKVFGGGGGTILPHEIDDLHAHGIARIYSPDDGRAMGLQGMINDLLSQCDFPLSSLEAPIEAALKQSDGLARVISLAENNEAFAKQLKHQLEARLKGAKSPVLGITGTGGAGKSSLVDEFIRRYLIAYPQKHIAVISIDPSKRKTGGALLGDRIRMNAVHHPRVYMRSLATRQSHMALSSAVQSAIDVVRAAGFDLVVVETSGIGQSDTEIVDHADVSAYVMTADYGAATQLEKIDMIDYADVIAINKFDRAGALDALRDVRRQFRRSRLRFEEPDENLPIYGTIASQFNDSGADQFFAGVMAKIEQETTPTFNLTADRRRKSVVPAERVNYLADIADTCRRYDEFVEQQAQLARQISHAHGLLSSVSEETAKELNQLRLSLEEKLHPDSAKLLKEWPGLVERYQKDKYEFKVRDKVFTQDLVFETLSGTLLSRVYLPTYQDAGDQLKWMMQENVPGAFPYTAGVFPLKRQGEAPARMFAGEGGPERTNRRFHYLSRGLSANRLSTAFDSVTLYGEDPDRRPDIYGKIGNSGVSVCSVDDAKKLYSGFDLTDPKTSVSMTINGPAPIILAFFMNAAIDQGCEKYIRSQGLEKEIQSKVDRLYQGREGLRPRYEGDLPEGHDGLGLLLLGVQGHEVLPREIYEKIKADALKTVRGTVQADILKEDQAQNTCIFSTDFALRLMGDVQAYFIQEGVRNFYSVSISGYHIAEAGANPISQLAFTLANGFTYVEYYLSRGMEIDEFAPNLSFFFSNGMDPEYSVLGRVARRIWAKAMALRYGSNERSQKLKYHIQTSGRSLHAQEIAFNDIRTTLQALSALSDNCNSLHTNAYDEAITTPTEESVRRALAIQLIIDNEFGYSKNENPLQGSFFIEELTNRVESAVLQEFRRLSERGGVIGAMERMYQRTKIQEESMHYEMLKHSGDLVLVGVNTFLDPAGSPTIIPDEVIRATSEEKDFALSSKLAFQERYTEAANLALQNLRVVCLEGKNSFEALLAASQVATLGQISSLLYEVGGQYRRNM